MECPKCSKGFVVPIRYGMPGPEMQQDYYEGKIKLGGCTMDVNNPDYHCNDCRYEWQRGKRNDGHYYNKDETFTHFKNQQITKKDRIYNSVIMEEG